MDNEGVEHIGKDMLDVKVEFKAITDTYDILVVELPIPLTQSVFRWFFDLNCKGKILVLALGDRCNLSDRLLLNKFGVDNYAEKDNLSDIKYNLNIMSKKIKIMNELLNGI